MSKQHNPAPKQKNFYNVSTKSGSYAFPAKQDMIPGMNDMIYRDIVFDGVWIGEYSARCEAGVVSEIHVKWCAVLQDSMGHQTLFSDVAEFYYCLTHRTLDMTSTLQGMYRNANNKTNPLPVTATT